MPDSAGTFTESRTPQTFTVTATDDSHNDDGESLLIRFSHPLAVGAVATEVRIGTPSETTVRLVDDDQGYAEGSLKLVAPAGSDEGQLQVHHDDCWGLVCDTDFDPKDAKVACRQLGYGGSGTGGLPFWLNHLKCAGTESRLLDCPGARLRTYHCGGFDIAGVECSRTALAVTDARVAGAPLTLRHNAALDAGSAPSGGDFVVLAGSAAVPVGSVAVTGSEAVLMLARLVRPDETVRLSYLVAPMHPVRTPSGMSSAPLTDEPVRNETAMAMDREGLGSLIASVAFEPFAIAPPDAARLLDLSGRGVEDVSALASLRELNLRDNAVADLGPLAGLTGLRVLDVGPLAGLTGLERLDLSGNRIAGVSALSGLTGLEVLLLDGNGIGDVLPLWSLQGLVHLGLAGNRIVDIGLLAELRSLQRLDLSGNRVSDVSPLGDLSGLVWLRLPGNPVSDVAPLGRLTLLRRLWLDTEVAGRELLDANTRGTAVPLWIGGGATREQSGER